MNGWRIEAQFDHQYLRHNFYMRSPTVDMVGRCYITAEDMEVVNGGDYPIAYMDERILIKADLYTQMQIPRGEVVNVDIGVPVIHPSQMRGEDHEWMIYTADQQGTELIITPEKIPEIMKLIVEAQEPRAREIIHSQRQREFPKLQTKAKILAFG
jgi:hypothetical protein